LAGLPRDVGEDAAHHLEGEGHREGHVVQHAGDDVGHLADRVGDELADILDCAHDTVPQGAPEAAVLRRVDVVPALLELLLRQLLEVDRAAAGEAGQLAGDLSLPASDGSAGHGVDRALAEHPGDLRPQDSFASGQVELAYRGGELEVVEAGVVTREYAPDATRVRVALVDLARRALAGSAVDVALRARGVAQDVGDVEEGDLPRDADVPQHPVEGVHEVVLDPLQDSPD